MNIFSFLYQEVLYRPLFNALVFLTAFLPGHDVGLAIILLTLLVRFILLPLSHKSLTTQIKLKKLEPEIKKIRDGSKDKTDEGRKTMELYREHGVSPFSGCFTLLIQLPILIALYQVFWRGVSFSGVELYPFISRPDFFQIQLFGFLDLAGRSWVLAAVAALSQFLQIRLALPSIPKGGGGMQEEFSRAFAIQSRYILPLVIFYISLRLPAALSLYWTVTNIFGIVHEGLVKYRAGNVYGVGRGENKGNN
ncbi:MAG: YidC/Oxa1 family membrane protein insertase [bacterium]|nr:YidC/Oxa1 family membrane protein insertase [bacterium]